MAVRQWLRGAALLGLVATLGCGAPAPQSTTPSPKDVPQAAIYDARRLLGEDEGGVLYESLRIGALEGGALPFSFSIATGGPPSLEVDGQSTAFAGTSIWLRATYRDDPSDGIAKWTYTLEGCTIAFHTIAAGARVSVRGSCFGLPSGSSIERLMRADASPNDLSPRDLTGRFTLTAKDGRGLTFEPPGDLSRLTLDRPAFGYRLTFESRAGQPLSGQAAFDDGMGLTFLPGSDAQCALKVHLVPDRTKTGGILLATVSFDPTVQDTPLDCSEFAMTYRASGVTD